MKTAEEILKEICKKHAGGDEDFDKTWNKIFIEKKNPKPEELMFLDILAAMQALETKPTPQPTIPGEYYRAVPVEERLPKTVGMYCVTIEYLDEHDVGCVYFNGQRLEHVCYRGMPCAPISWLEPIKIPSTREAASRGFEAGESYGMNSQSGRPDEMNKTNYLNPLYGTDTK